jgi:hypothetical protein
VQQIQTFGLRNSFLTTVAMSFISRLHAYYNRKNNKILVTTLRAWFGVSSQIKIMTMQ